MISATAPHNEYTGNGNTATYDFGFRIYKSTNLKVRHRAVDGTETLLTYPNDYQIGGVNNPTGGSITLVAGNLPTGERLFLDFEDEITQPTSIRNQGGLFLGAIEDALDLVTRFVQMLKRQLGRALQLPTTETPTEGALRLPALADRKNRFFGWDSAGNITPAVGTSANLGPVSGFIDSLLPAPDADAARVLLEAARLTTVVVKTGNYQVVAADREKLIILDGGSTITISALAAATLGAGFRFHLMSLGDGGHLFDPNGGELINKRTHLTIMPFTGATIFCDGTQFWTVNAALPATGAGAGSVRGLSGGRNATTTKFDLGTQRISFAGGIETEGFLSLQVNALAAGPVAGGRDQAGAFSNPSWIHLYAIYSPAGVACIASTVPPPVGPSVPGGYVRWTYLTTVRYTTEFADVRIKDDLVTHAADQVLAAGTATGLTNIDLSVAVPENAKTVLGFLGLTGITNGSGVIQANGSLGSTTGFSECFKKLHLTGAAASTTHIGDHSQFEIPLIITGPARIYYLIATITGSSVSLSVNVVGYRVPNGA